MALRLAFFAEEKVSASASIVRAFLTIAAGTILLMAVGNVWDIPDASWAGLGTALVILGAIPTMLARRARAV